MKLIFSAVFCLITLVSFSYPKLETFDVTERVFHTYVNGLEAKMFLGVNSFSDCSSYIYTVEGWYILGKSKKRLVGLYRYGELYLYHFEEDSLADKQNFDFYYGGFSWNEIDKIIETSNYTERITALHDDNHLKWFWEKSSYRKILNGYWCQKTSVFEEYDFLMLNENSRINLGNVVHLISPSFKIEAISKNKERILLSFWAMPRANACGQCGAGEKNGYIQLDFDESESLVNVKQVLLTSCDDDLYFANKTIKKNILSYDILYQADKIEYKVEIDLDKATVIQCKL